jgi:Ca-activated chloride channel family protein
MELANSLALALLVLAIPVALLGFRRRRGAYTVPTATAFSDGRPSFRMRAASALPALRVAAVMLLVVGIARPREGDAATLIPAEGIDIALSLDLSSSMLAAFGRGTNRLEATREVVREFIRQRENDRIGLVVFQEEALPISPPTLDHRALDALVAEMKTGILPDGTGIGVGLAAALNMLQNSNSASRVVILLTDGEHNARSISPEDATELAVALRVRVYTVAVVDSRQRLQGIDADLLQHIADRTGGRFFAADSPATLSDVYEEIGKIETTQVGHERYTSYTEFGPWLIGAAALVLLAELGLRASWLRRLPE